MRTSYSTLRCCGRVALLCLVSAAATAQQDQRDPLTLDTVLARTLADDDWLQASELREQAFREEAVAAGALPDPRLRLGLANLPVDDFRFDHEPMTQLQVGVSQAFPPGETRELNSRHKRQQSEMAPLARDVRRARLRRDITATWLQTWEARAAADLIRANREPFEQMVDVTEARYGSTGGNAAQRDVIRAELALTRLDDRLQRLRSRSEEAWQSLSQWVPAEWLSRDMAPALPSIDQPLPEVTSLSEAAEVFARHPEVRMLDKETEVARTGVELAREQFRPGFSVGASYGYRDDDPVGVSRSDFFSLEFSMDLPLFTAGRQQPRLAAATARAEALRSDWQLKVESLFGEYRRLMSRLEVVRARIDIYEDTLLPQMTTLAEANLAAYSADDNDFEEVMRAYIEELDHRVELLGLRAQEQQIHNQLDYLLTESSRRGE